MRGAGGWIFVEAVLRGEPGTPDAIAARMAEIADARNHDQPIRERTGGSTFKNPPGTSAWELIEEAGCRGLTRGGAQISPLHCNFLINTGGATAAELEGLGEEVRERVKPPPASGSNGKSAASAPRGVGAWLDP